MCTASSTDARKHLKACRSGPNTYRIFSSRRERPRPRRRFLVGVGYAEPRQPIYPRAIGTHTTPIKAIADAFLLHDVKANDIMCWPTSPGWMMGPWLIYAALGNAACMALYYDAPTTAAFCRFVSASASTFVGLVPSLVRAWRSNNATDNCNW